MGSGHRLKEKTSRLIYFGHPLGLKSKDPGETPKAGPSPGQRGHRPQTSLGLEIIFTTRFRSYTSHAVPSVLLRLASLIDKKQHFPR